MATVCSKKASPKLFVIFLEIAGNFKATFYNSEANFYTFITYS